jgi:hypothetical protein
VEFRKKISAILHTDELWLFQSDEPDQPNQLAQTDIES